MFIWDDANIVHIARHDVSQEEAELVVLNDPLDLERQIRNEEERFVHLGETGCGRVLVVIVTVRMDLYRVVTAYPADKAMRKFYHAKRAESYGKDAGNT